MHTSTLLSTSFIVFSVLTSTNATTHCKCFPGDSCWPSDTDFSALNETLSGHLIRGVPPASVCYTDQPNYSNASCEIVRSNWFSSSFHAADPISIGWPWWANNTCPPIYPNGTSVTGDPDAGKKGCSLGSFPVYSVNATEESHVSETVRWARKHNIRVNVKSTGHSFQGRSTGFGTISVWTHHMRGIEWHDNFLPESCPLNETQMAATFAAGERGRDVYEAANDHNAVVVAGSAQDVGIVGWFSGGGHGPLSSTYGLGVDNVLQIRIVTPAGEHLVANPCLNPDLFWAARGGGGSTFGIITSVTMKAYPSPKVSRHTFSLSLADPKSESKFWDLVAYVMGELPRLKQGGMQGYSVILPPVPGISPYGGAGVSPTWSWFWSFDVHDKPNGTIESLFEPIAKKLDPENGTSVIYTSSVSHYTDFFTLWNSTIGDEPVASGGASLGSRLLPATSLTQDPAHLADVLKNLSAAAEGGSPPILQPYLVANDHTGKNGDVSVTPAWGDAVLHFIVTEGFNDSDTFQDAKPVIDRVTYQRVAALKSLAPESGAYINEADPYDPNWQYDFWGKNYPRLRNIKEKYDPDSVLWCISCVGSEEWAEVGAGQLCRKQWARNGRD